MNKAPAYQRYSKDYLASVRVQMMTLAEEGAYNRLLEYCWINGSIPADPGKLARLVGKGCTVEIAKVCLEMFVPDPGEPDKMIHDRLEQERKKQESNSEARREAAAVRWNKQGKSDKNGKSGKPAEARGTRDEAANGNGKQAKSKADANALQTDMQNDALHIASSYTTLSSSNEKERGGKPPPSADASKLDIQGGESGQAYLDRKQTEFTNKPVLEIYRKFVGLCGSERYPHLRNTRRQFDKWLENEDDTLDIPLEEEKFVVPGIGELK